jgi:hypothetical protein
MLRPVVGTWVRELRTGQVGVVTGRCPVMLRVWWLDEPCPRLAHPRVLEPQPTPTFARSWGLQRRLEGTNTRNSVLLPIHDVLARARHPAAICRALGSGELWRFEDKTHAGALAAFKRARRHPVHSRVQDAVLRTPVPGGTAGLAVILERRSMLDHDDLAASPVLKSSSWTLDQTWSWGDVGAMNTHISRFEALDDDGAEYADGDFRMRAIAQGLLVYLGPSKIWLEEIARVVHTACIGWTLDYMAARGELISLYKDGQWAYRLARHGFPGTLADFIRAF